MNKMDSCKFRVFLFSVLKASSSEESVRWLEQKVIRLEKQFSEREFYLTFGLSSRYFSKEKITLPDDLKPEADQLKKGFNPFGFSCVQAARIALALIIPSEDLKRYLKILDNLFSTGEINELVALYSALPMLPHPESLRSRASEGIRTNMTVVFDAIALNNPYPSEFLDDDAFNQMVLKAVFIERPLDMIYGLDKRANQKLARMLTDYAHERWAASRYVTPELWRPIGPFLDEELLRDVERLLEQGSELEKQAAVLAFNSSGLAVSKELIPPELKAGFEKKEFTWQTISQKWFAEKNKSQ